MERLREGMGDKVAICLQFISQFFAGKAFYNFILYHREHKVTVNMNSLRAWPMANKCIMEHISHILIGKYLDIIFGNQDLT